MTLFERCVITLMCALFRVLVYQNSHVSVFSQSRVCLVLIISESGKPSLVAAQRALAGERYIWGPVRDTIRGVSCFNRDRKGDESSRNFTPADADLTEQRDVEARDRAGGAGVGKGGDTPPGIGECVFSTASERGAHRVGGNTEKSDGGGG